MNVQLWVCCLISHYQASFLTSPGGAEVFVETMIKISGTAKTTLATSEAGLRLPEADRGSLQPYCANKTTYRLVPGGI
jgi:hypothetical protein